MPLPQPMSMIRLGYCSDEKEWNQNLRISSGTELYKFMFIYDTVWTSVYVSNLLSF